MTDRELLELAAMAAGITHLLGGWFDDVGQAGLLSGRLGNGRSVWNPLADDGDALRLAVKLNLGISIPVHQTIRADVVCFRDASVNAREGGDDPHAAARRAIVRAAAEIGKAMP